MTEFPSITREEGHLLHAIARRAAQETGVDMLTIEMDLTNCHARGGCPLKLKELLEAPKADFGHDIAGIYEHIDRETGELKDCFVPRYAAPESEATP